MLTFAVLASFLWNFSSRETNDNLGKISPVKPEKVSHSIHHPLGTQCLDIGLQKHVSFGNSVILDQNEQELYADENSFRKRMQEIRLKMQEDRRHTDWRQMVPLVSIFILGCALFKFAACLQ